MTLPCTDLELEARYVGTVASDPSVLMRYPVPASAFVGKPHARVLASIEALVLRKAEVDPASIEIELRKMGVGVDRDELRSMLSVIDIAPSALAGRLVELHAARKLRDAALDVARLAETSTLTSAIEASRRLSETKDPAAIGEETHASMAGAVRSALEAIVEASKSNAPAQITTGISALDEGIGGGMERGDLMVLGGDTSAGKSSTALFMAVQQAKAGRRPGIVSVEDPRVRVGRRALSVLSGVPIRKMRDGALSTDDWNAITIAVNESTSCTVHFAFRIGGTLAEVTESIRWLTRERGCDVIYLDYIQAVEVPEHGIETREKMRRILAAAKRECNDAPTCAALVALSQYRKRDDETEKPTRAALYESNYIAQKAENIVLLWKDKHGVLSGVVDKSKDEATGVTFQLRRDRKGHLSDGSVDDTPHPADHGPDAYRRSMGR